MTLRPTLTGALLTMALPLPSAPVESGLDVLVADQLDLLRGKSIAIVCNHTAVTRDGVHIVDRLSSEQGITIKALFGPEHGIRGTANAGAAVQSSAESGIPVYSLYDDSRAPDPAELEGVDLILYDIQDVGARFYTYISTLGYVLEAGAQNGIPVMVLDRPDMISGLNAEGPICEPQWFTFVGRYPIPVRYSLTPGELAQMMVGERWISGAADVDLTVIPCRGWTRSTYYDETGLPFLRPSPNIPGVEAALVYPGTCFFEGTNVSEGRGTEAPFLIIGAPFVDSARWVAALEACQLPGVTFAPITFTPEPNEGASRPKLRGEECHGVRIAVTDRAAFRPVRTGLAMLWTLTELWPDDFEIGQRANHFDRLWGTSAVREALDRLRTQSVGSWQEIADSWRTPDEQFWQRARRHQLYE